jgi:hypothetical protein
MNKIYAFYDSIQTENQSEEFSCANYWKTSWEQNGWETAMLNRSHAQSCPMYGKLQQKVMNLGLSLPPELATEFNKISARFARWCALHAAGGGWMSDYDVFNRSFKPEAAEKTEEKNTLLIVGEPAYLFYATQEHCGKAIKKFLTSEFMKDDKLVPEYELLEINQTTAGYRKSVVHVKKTEDETRSSIMQKLLK